MGLEDDILKLLKTKGYRINEAIRDALDEFLVEVEDANEPLDDDLDEDEEDFADEGA